MIFASFGQDKSPAAAAAPVVTRAARQAAEAGGTSVEVAVAAAKAVAKQRASEQHTKIVLGLLTAGAAVYFLVR